ncbi:MAG: hypothetical protein BWY09_03170 [Candidatus Hydrogenedentes bacterium ADurb.Bin179]|nr:MAG: hypothetical protein BWY09_03170 [Candidatus Hydrogenedentes bacterium ADurb.Bin179]
MGASGGATRHTAVRSSSEMLSAITGGAKQDFQSSRPCSKEPFTDKRADGTQAITHTNALQDNIQHLSDYYITRLETKEPKESPAHYTETKYGRHKGIKDIIFFWPFWINRRVLGLRKKHSNIVAKAYGCCSFPSCTWERTWERNCISQTSRYRVRFRVHSAGSRSKTSLAIASTSPYW